MVDASFYFLVLEKNDLPEFEDKSFCHVVQDRKDLLVECSGRQSVIDVVEHQFDHGFFLHAQVLLDLFGYPGAHDALNNRVLLKNVKLYRESEDFFLTLRQAQVDLLALT